MDVKVALFPTARVRVVGEVMLQGGCRGLDTVLLQPVLGRRPLGTGDRSAHCAPLAFPWHPSRAGISPSQEGAEQAARPAPGQGERCLVERTQPFAIRSPGGSRVFVSARSREEKPGSYSGSATLLGQANTRAQGCYPAGCPIPSARQWGLCPMFLFLGWCK